MTTQLSERLAARLAEARANRPDPPSEVPILHIGIASLFLFGGLLFVGFSPRPVTPVSSASVVHPGPPPVKVDPEERELQEFLSNIPGGNESWLAHRDYIDLIRSNYTHKQALCLAKDNYYGSPIMFRSHDDLLGESAENKARAKKFIEEKPSRLAACMGDGTQVTGGETRWIFTPPQGQSYN